MFDRLRFVRTQATPNSCFCAGPPPIVGPYSQQINEAAAGFAGTTLDTWQGTQQQTAGGQTSAAPQGSGQASNAADNSDTTDPWLATFFGDGQNATSASGSNAPNPTGQPSTNGNDTASENASGDDDLPEPTFRRTGICVYCGQSKDITDSSRHISSSAPTGYNHCPCLRRVQQPQS